MVVQHAETLSDVQHVPIVLQTEGIIYSASAPKLNSVISTPPAGNQRKEEATLSHKMGN